MSRSPFPLQWPEGFARTKEGGRLRSKFGFKSSGQVSLSVARDELLLELGRLGAANFVITSDLPVNRAGLPYASGRVSDPGVAAWFILADQERVFSCDRWLSHAENMQAIAKSISAMRGLERWGMADVVERVIGGFAALPAGGETSNGAPPPPRKRTWREVLNMTGSVMEALAKDDQLAIMKTRHRDAIKVAHPDRGGDPALAAEINAALAEAERELARTA